MKRCVIVGGADINNYEYIKSCLRNDDFIVFCDSGLKHLESLQVKPGLIVGDFDSHDNPHLGVETIVLPCEKDDTDTVFAVKEAIKRGFDDFLLIGVVGARLDHTLGNVSSLLYLDSLGKKGYSQIDEEDFFEMIPMLREKCGDRAVLRGIHFYQENTRVSKQVSALEQGDFETFLKLIKESGYSSYMYLQNVIPIGSKEHQNAALVLALCEHYLCGRGAYRVHGGGFAGTVQAFVPFDILDAFRTGMDEQLGQGACHVLRIRSQGGVELATE